MLSGSEASFCHMLTMLTILTLYVTGHIPPPTDHVGLLRHHLHHHCCDLLQLATVVHVLEGSWYEQAMMTFWSDNFDILMLDADKNNTNDLVTPKRFGCTRGSSPGWCLSSRCRSLDPSGGSFFLSFYFHFLFLFHFEVLSGLFWLLLLSQQIKQERDWNFNFRLLSTEKYFSLRNHCFPKMRQIHIRMIHHETVSVLL